MENGARRGGAADEVQGREDLSMAGLGRLPKQAAVIWDFSWGYGTHFSTTLALICSRRSNTRNDKQKNLDFGFDQSPWSSAANNLLRACHDSFPCISVLFSFQLSTSTKLIFQAFSNKLN
jgi:hypothetical protein